MFDIGFSYRPELFPSICKNIDLFDFFEFVPDGVPDDPNIEVVKNLKFLSKTKQITAHSIDLSIASIDDSEFENRFEQIDKLIDMLDIDHYSDHMAFTRTSSLNCDAYVPPVFAEHSVRNISNKINYIYDKSRRKNIRFGLENVANTILADKGNIQQEGDFLKAVTKQNDIELILNIDSLIISSSVLDVDPIVLLETYPLSAIKGVTIVPPTSMNPIMNNQYGSLVEKLAIDVLRDALNLITPERVLIQVRYAHNTIDTFSDFLSEIKLLKENSKVEAIN